jgi:hypothetical protein
MRVAALLGVFALTMSSGCVHKAAPEGGLGQALAQADLAFNTADPGFLGRVRTHLDRAARVGADDPEVLWRRARWLVAVGLTAEDPEDAAASYAEAREVAARCLDADAAFARRRRVGGWTPALELVPVARRACADQLAWAWTRWWLEVGPSAAALDGPTLAVLVDRTGGPDLAWARALVVGAQGADGWVVLSAMDDRYEEDPAWMADAAWLARRAAQPSEAKRWELRLQETPDGPRSRAAVARLARWSGTSR